MVWNSIHSTSLRIFNPFDYVITLSGIEGLRIFNPFDISYSPEWNRRAQDFQSIRLRSGFSIRSTFLIALSGIEGLRIFEKRRGTARGRPCRDVLLVAEGSETALIGCGIAVCPMASGSRFVVLLPLGVSVAERDV